ncbi:MAG: NYN domain-containing protein [Ornithinimicrobium sp.]
MGPTTNVYVDGFNLYYAIRKTPYKWLDPGQLFRQLLPQNDIQRIRYFTARIKPRPGDPLGPDRQDVYLRALATVPGLSLHYGKFLASTKYMRLVDPPEPPQLPTVEVHHMEEKGSDVNLATWMLVDAYENDCEQSVLVTNDSDLAFPMQILSQRLGRKVGLVNPWDANPSRMLMREGPTFVRRLRHGLLAASQFPDEIDTGTRQLYKPPAW